MIWAALKKRRQDHMFNIELYTTNNYGTENSIYRVQIVKISQQLTMYPK